MKSGRRRFSRCLLLTVLGAAIVSAAVGVWYVVREQEKSVILTASRLLKCPAERVELLSSSTGDTADVYRVRACGREVTLMCSSPDFECFALD